jgi:uncharacterized coiled-coil protein SlyX
MSVIDDTRKLMRDFLSPELREIAARIDALETRLNIQDHRIGQRFSAQDKFIEARFKVVDEQFKRVDDRFSDQEKSLDTRFKAAEGRAAERHAQVIEALSKLSEVNELKVRVARIESRERAS